jgi:hypothetical protein
VRSRRRRATPALESELVDLGAPAGAAGGGEQGQAAPAITSEPTALPTDRRALGAPRAGHPGSRPRPTS